MEVVLIYNGACKMPGKTGARQLVLCCHNRKHKILIYWTKNITGRGFLMRVDMLRQTLKS